MSKEEFRFKEFSIQQALCTMKVGTDAVLLGSWSEPLPGSNILDIGTGSGILALMMAQKSTGTIDAIDIDQGAYQQAKINVSNSRWHERIQVYNTSLQSFLSLSGSKRYGHIISNPPYFSGAYKSADNLRNLARHTDQLNFRELILGVVSLLEQDGYFDIILPAAIADQFMSQCRESGLFLHHLLNIVTKAGKSPKRVIMRFNRNRINALVTSLIITDEQGAYTDEYKSLTSNFYLNL